MVKTRTSRAIAGTFTGILQYGFTILLQFILAPIVLKLSGSNVLGAYSFLMQIVSWAALTDLGFGVAVGRYLAQAVGIDDNHKKFQDVFATGRTFYIGSNLAFALIILFVSWRINTILPMSINVEYQAKFSLILLAIWVIIRTPLSLFSDALIATQNLVQYNLIATVSSVLRLLLSLLFVFFGANLIGLMLANIIAEFVQYLLSYLIFKRVFAEDKFGWGISDMKLFREMLTFGFSYMIVMISGKLTSNTDSIILGYLHGATAVSIFYTSQMPATMLYQIIWKFADNSAPAINELHARNALSQISVVYNKLLRYSLLFALPLAIGLIGLNSNAITLWVGSKQYAGNVFTLALSVFAFTQVVIHLNCVFLVAYGKIRMTSIFFISIGIIKVIIAYLFIKSYGIKGTMLACAFVDIFSFLYFNNRVWKMISLRFKEIMKNIYIPVLKSSILLVIIIGIKIFFDLDLNTWLKILTFTFCFTIIWLIGILIFGLLPEERNYFKGLVIKKFKLNSI